MAFLEGTDAIVPYLERAGVRCVRLLLRTEFVSSPLADFTPRCVLRFRALYREFQPDVVHAHVPRSTLWAAWAKRLYGRRLPFVYSEHNVQEAYPAWSRWVFRTFLPSVDHVVCVSEAARQGFLRQWRWPEHRVTTVWNGIVPGRVQGKREPLQTRDEIGGQASGQVVLNVANLTYRKAQEVLVAAMALVHREQDQAQCWIAGSPDIEPAAAVVVRQAVAQRGAEDYVKLLGARRDVPDLLAACDVFVLSSRQEGFPITILEAMAAGKPVVATDVGGCAEAVADGETGLIVPPDNPKALAEAIKHILDHPDEARRMGEAGRRRVEEHFTVEAMVAKHVEVYERVIAEARRR